MNSAENNYILSYSGLELEEALQSAYTCGEDIHDIKNSITHIEDILSGNGSALELWSQIQNYGKRNNYTYAFQYWGATDIKPPRYKIVPTDGSANSMFAKAEYLTEILSQYIDLSQLPADASAAYMCNGCTNLIKIEDIGLKPPTNYQYTWNKCSNLTTIENINSNISTKWTNSFSGCDSLQNITITGEIGNNIDLSPAPNLTLDSLLSVKQALVSGNNTITLSQASYDKLDADGHITDITNNIGWSVTTK